MAVLGALLLPCCLKCGAIMAQTDNLCSSCWHGVEFILPPLYYACDIPFKLKSDGKALCGACIRVLNAVREEGVDVLPLARVGSPSINP